MNNHEEIEKWEEMLENNEENLEAIANLGLLFAQKGEFIQAEIYFRKGFDLVPDDTWFLFNLGTTLQHLKKYSEAEDIFNQLLQYEPDNIDVMQKLARIGSAEGNHSGAIDIFKEILEIKPEDAVTWLNIGNEYSSLEEYSKAEEAYCQAITIDPQFLKAYMNLCRVYELSGNIEELSKLLKECIGIFPYSTYFISIQNRINKINFYLPVVYHAKIEKQYELGNYHAMVISEINSWGDIKYKYLLYFYKENEEIPCYYVSLEENSMFELGGDQYFFCAFNKEGHINYGFFEGEPTVENFSSKALTRVKEEYNIS